MNQRLANVQAREREGAMGFRIKHWSTATPALSVLFLLSLVLAAGAWLSISGFQRSAIRLRNARGMPFRAIVFEPLAARRLMSDIVVCQPLNSPPEAGQGLILEFVRRGMLVVTFDTRGQTREENRVTLRENVLAVTALDAAAVLNYVSARRDVDRSRVGLIGHSAGGTLAIRAGIEQPWVRATIAVGIAGDVTHELPRNLLWLVGLYDEFRPLLQMQEVMEASNADGVSQAGVTTGDFQLGTARRLEITATADHFTEFVNHGTAVRAVEWFESAFQGRPAPRPRLAIAPWFLASYSLVFLFGWLWLYSRVAAGGGWPRRHPRLFTLTTAGLLLALVLVPAPRFGFLRADLILWGLALLLGVNAGLRAGRAVWLIPLGWLSFLLTLVVNQTAYFWRSPPLALALPAFAFWHATGLLNSYLFIYPRALFFSDYTSAVLRPGWPVLGLLALEMARPGIVLGSVKRLFRKPDRQPAAAAGSRTWLGLAVALALFSALAVILWLRAAQGFVDREALQLAGWVILRFALLPFFIFALLKRWLTRWEASSRRSGSLSQGSQPL